MKKRLLLIVVSLLLLISSGVVLAAYSADITVTENGTGAHEMLACDVPANIDYMAANDFFALATGLDTRVQKGGIDQPHMLRDDTIMFATPVPQNSTSTLQFVTDETPQDFYIVPGYSDNSTVGFITTLDDVDLELGNDFAIEQKGWVNTDNASDKNLVYKEDAFRTYISGATDITSEIATDVADSIAPFSSTSDGKITKTFDGNYLTARDSATGIVSAGGTTTNIGQQLSMTYYEVQRSFFFFDTSAIPDTATITSATLSLYGQTKDTATADFDMVIQNGQPTYPHDPLVIGDYAHANYAGDGGSFNTAGLSTVAYNVITLNAAGEGWINLTGTTKLMVRSSLDIASTAPIDHASEVAVYTSEEAGDTKDPKLTVNYTYPGFDGSVAVTATGVASGEHDIVVGADGVDFWISVDGAVAPAAGYDEVALAGAAVPDNANNWIIGQNNVMPYMEYYKHTTAVGGSSLKAWYQPIDIIAGTVLPDRQGADEPGAFTWGSNPIGIAVTLGAMSSDYSGADVDPAGAQDIAPVLTPPPASPADAARLIGLADNPLTPIIHIFSEVTGIYELWFWWVGSIIIGLMLFGLSYKWLRNMILSGSLFCAVIAFFIALGVYDLWVVMILIVILFGCVMMQSRRTA